MPQGYGRLFSTYTDAQLLALAVQRDTLVGAARAALDEELKKRGYDPDNAESLKPGNFARLLATYTDEQLLVLASQRETLHEEGQAALDEELRRRRFAPNNLVGPSTGTDRKQIKLEVDSVSKFFLSAPNWKIFLLLSILYFAGFFMLSMGNFAPIYSLRDIGKPTFIAVILITMSLFCYVTWQWSLGSFLSRITHPVLSMKTGFFHFALFYPPIYVPFFFAALLAADTRLSILIIPFHLFAMFCLFYDIYFLLKSLALAETSRPVSFYDYAGPFFLLWFFPFGIWMIQPRVNRLYESRILNRAR